MARRRARHRPLSLATRTQPRDWAAGLSQQAHSCTRLEGGRKARQVETRSSERRREEELVAADEVKEAEEEEGRLVRPGECPRSMMMASSLSCVRKRCDVGRGGL